jgi:CheY-like chemotaxis protein
LRTPAPADVDVFRLFETTKPNGTGLGLPIVRQIVAAHGGGIDFAPVLLMEPHSASSSPKVDPVAPCSAISILLVDREPGFRSALAGMLREDGHDVVECPDAGELPRVEVLGRFDVLLCAHEMPAENGLWLADRVHAAHPALPAILLAAYLPSALGHELAERPFLRLVEKPLSYDDLHQLIHELASAWGASVRGVTMH